MLKRDNVEKKFVLYFYYCHAIPIAVPVRFLVNMYLLDLALSPEDISKDLWTESESMHEIRVDVLATPSVFTFVIITDVLIWSFAVAIELRFLLSESGFSPTYEL